MNNSQSKKILYGAFQEFDTYISYSNRIYFLNDDERKTFEKYLNILNRKEKLLKIKNKIDEKIIQM
jgi:hypothetical protein